MMQRRQFVGLVGGAAAWPMVARAQQSTMPVVGWLSPESAGSFEGAIRAFRQGLGVSGYIEGRNVVIEFRWAEGQNTRLPVLAADLVKRHPEVIFAPPSPAALAASRATRTIPVVFSMNADPVKLGLVSNLARPGGNVTGVTYTFDSIAPKRVEILKLLLPTAKRVGVLFDPSDLGAQADVRSLEEMKARLGVSVVPEAVRSSQELDGAMEKLLAQAPDAILIIGTLLFNLRRRVYERASAKRTPVTGASLAAEDGALFAFGFSLDERIRRGAYYVDRILKGAKPGELPVEQLSKLELVVNLRVAKSLGIEIPAAALLRADRVIE